MTHLWIRAEQRLNEQRVGVTPTGAQALLEAGFKVTLEQDPTRTIEIEAYVGTQLVGAGAWQTAPRDAIIMGLKELPDDGLPLRHRHIMFGHAYKDQPSGQRLLARFKAGGGTLYDLEYLTNDAGHRIAAFGYWAGYAGAAVALKSWAAAQVGELCAPVKAFARASDLVADVTSKLGPALPTVIIIGTNGRVGTGATDFCAALGAPVTSWDMAETAHGGPYPEILAHDIFLNCILANQDTPVFVTASAKTDARKLMVIGDIACDPDSAYSPIKVYDQATSWEKPALRAQNDPILDVTAIDNLPSILPRESSEDFASQLLPSLLALKQIDGGVWGKAKEVFDRHVGSLG